MLAAVDGDKVQLAAGVTADSGQRSRPVSWSTSWPSKWAAKGGSKPDLAMAAPASGVARCAEQRRGLGGRARLIGQRLIEQGPRFAGLNL